MVRHATQQRKIAGLNGYFPAKAHHLQTLGVQPNTLVGICLNRSPDYIISLLAVWKIGATAVPLDPSYPADRIAFMLQDTATPLARNQLTNVVPGATPPTRLAYAAAVVGFGVYLAGFIASWFLPEPKGDALPE